MTCWVKTDKAQGWADLAKASRVEFEEGMTTREAALNVEIPGSRIPFSLEGMPARTAWAEFERYVERERMRGEHLESSSIEVGKSYPLRPGPA